MPSNVNRKGYLFFSANFALSQAVIDTAYTIDIPLQPIEAQCCYCAKEYLLRDQPV